MLVPERAPAEARERRRVRSWKGEAEYLKTHPSEEFKIAEGLSLSTARSLSRGIKSGTLNAFKTQRGYFDSFYTDDGRVWAVYHPGRVTDAKGKDS